MQDSRLGKYHEENRKIRAEYAQKKAALDTEFAAYQNEVHRLSKKIESSTSIFNSELGSFIRFFIENKDLLSGEAREFVDAWQKDNSKAIKELSTVRDELSNVMEKQNDTMGQIEMLHQDIQLKILDLAANFRSFVDKK